MSIIVPVHAILFSLVLKRGEVMIKKDVRDCRLYLYRQYPAKYKKKPRSRHVFKIIIFFHNFILKKKTIRASRKKTLARFESLQNINRVVIVNKRFGFS